jgi:DNA ligase D-like protein (predicted polymerase)
VAAPAELVEVDTPSGVREVRVSNPEKVYFPGLGADGGRKIDLVTYWLTVAEGALRAVGERPTVLKRHPGGVTAEAIYQKRVPASRPPWIETARVEFPSGRSAEELCPVDAAHLVWAASYGVIDLHPWPSRRADTEHPDELRIDLDPQPGTDYGDVRGVAAEVHALLDELGLVGWPKTSGSKGLHVYVRISPEYSFTQCRRAVLAVAREVERRLPDLATSKWWREERGERVFLDYNRMARDQTIASAYSPRARAEGTVSAPLRWDEVPDAETADFTLVTMRRRWHEIGDPHAGIDDAVGSLQPLLELAERHERDHGLGDAPYPPQFPKMPGEPLRVQPSRAKRRPDDPVV